MMALAGQNAAAVERFVEALQSPGLISNLKTKVEGVYTAHGAFPLSLNAADEHGNCYICRPSAAYIDYALDEIRHFKAQPLLHGAMAGLLHLARPLVRASGLDDQVQLNNWLFSTNPVPALGVQSAKDLRDRLLARYPARAIVLRSLNPVADGPTMSALEAAGFLLLPARRIWLLDCRTPLRLSRDQRRDQVLLADGRFEAVLHEAFGPAEFEAAASLYGQLYLQKYSRLNPHYTAGFLQALHGAGALHLWGLRDKESGRMVAATGLHQSGQTLTQPVVGYDTDLPLDLGLYRRMMAYSTARALEGRQFFNMSAGAAGFKRNRGALPAIEYTAVYVAHLPFKARKATGLMKDILTKIGIPLLERFEL